MKQWQKIVGVIALGAIGIYELLLWLLLLLIGKILHCIIL